MITSTLNTYLNLPAWGSQKGKIALNWLRWVALAGMMMDHVGTVLYPNTVFDDVAGLIGITQPLIAFSLAWGVTFTSDWVQYLKRVVLLAIISEIPFQLSGLGVGHVNEIWALALGVLACVAEDRKKGLGLVFVAVAVLAPVCCFLTGLCWFAKFTQGRDEEYFIGVSMLAVILAYIADWTLISWCLGGLSILMIRYFNLPEIGRNKIIIYGIYPFHLVVLAVLRSLCIA